MYKKQGPKIRTSKQVPWLMQGWGSDVEEWLTEEMMEDFRSSSVEPFDSDLLLASLFPLLLKLYFNIETLERFF